MDWGWPPNKQGSDVARTVIGNNAELGVTWIHSYVTPDKTQTYCIYDAPWPEAIRQTANKNGLPVGKISEVSVLDPYLHI